MLNTEISWRSYRRIERCIKEANRLIWAVPEEIERKSASGLPEALLSQLLNFRGFLSAITSICSLPEQQDVAKLIWLVLFWNRSDTC